MSAIRAPRAPRPPRTPGLPQGAPRPTRAPRPVAFTAEALRGYDPQPPEWSGSDLEWICWNFLTKKGCKIFGRQNVPGRTFYLSEADVVYQGAIPTPGLNVDKPFFRSDFILLPGGRAPGAGPAYPRGIVWDPRNDFTHRNAGLDRLRRAYLAKAGYLLVWIDGNVLLQNPKPVLTAAWFGSSNSALDRGER